MALPPMMKFHQPSSLSYPSWAASLLVQLPSRLHVKSISGEHTKSKVLYFLKNSRFLIVRHVAIESKLSVCRSAQSRREMYLYASATNKKTRDIQHRS